MPPAIFVDPLSLPSGSGLRSIVILFLTLHLYPLEVYAGSLPQCSGLFRPTFAV